ncbi:conserved protein of unknown function [Candidatus Hydrogenisulfobacillus filiaventi]|uniref:DUF488 family protein n=1 Tax=Candidatus Hydrogenisulfobacillus filiaventi TaxID=2707344 RepID=A0A6F8ZEQ6_9FIRM|nr:DUF488 family protein [Bacillota bacterium]CAB1128174.1 conserved protein of unknown function [Candidatus Hydrogenisulfobacillus filiaventi]
MEITLGRVGDAPTPPGAVRVLVDRLWPRGISKASAPWDHWLKEVAPSDGLRRWYHAHPGEQAEFARRYREELQDPVHQAALARLRELGRSAPLMLLTFGRDIDHSQLPVLRAVLEAES